MGNGKMIGAIINSFEKGKFPLPGGNCEVRGELCKW